MGASVPEGLDSGRPRFYEFRDGSSDKFWGGFQDGKEWVCVWGRNGKPPQGSMRVSASEFDVRATAKRRSGYVRSSLDPKAMFLDDRAWFAKAAVSAEFRAALEAAELSEVVPETPSRGRRRI